jgi:hypothetical protein
MRREVVQDFLNLPGIAGVALIDGRSRPYFCGIDQILNFQQKEALAQGIQQVVETTPAGFEFFEFQFTGHQVYIYKLDHGIILLVLTSNSLVAKTYVRAVELLKHELQEDIANAIATFRILAGNITLSNQDYWNRRVQAPTSKTTTDPVPTKPSVPNRLQGYAPPENQIVSSNLTPGLERSPTTSLNSAPSNLQPTQLPQTPAVYLKDIVNALNHLSLFTTQYLGTTVIANYWKSTRPPIDWLNIIQIDRSAQFTYSGAGSSHVQVIGSEEHRLIQEWVSAFIQRCSKVIRDFPLIIEQRALDDQQKMLLLPNKP